MPLPLDVVNVPPLKLKTGMFCSNDVSLLATTRDCTVMLPPAAKMFVPVLATTSVPFGELMAPPFVTISTPALIIVFPE